MQPKSFRSKKNSIISKKENQMNHKMIVLAMVAAGLPTMTEAHTAYGITNFLHKTINYQL